MVLGPPKTGKPVRFKVRLDGAVPGDDCGGDSTPNGAGEVREPVFISSSGKRVK
jgi:hypothetical protein